MAFEITEHVPGLSDEHVAALVSEAEAGYDLSGLVPRRNPHFQGSSDEQRIVADHRVIGGVPCVRDTRIPVNIVVGLLNQGLSVDEIVADYPQLTPDDIRAAVEFAARP